MSDSLSFPLPPYAAVATGRPVSTMINRSGTVTAGGTAQTIAASNSNRRGFWIQNVSTSDIWISSIGTAAASQPSIKIPPNALYEMPSHGVSTGAVSLFGAVTGQAFSAREW